MNDEHEQPAALPPGFKHTYQCGRKDCREAGAKLPAYRVWGRVEKNHDPAELVLRLPICEEHVASTTLADYLTDEGKATINAAFVEQRKLAPAWSTAELFWVGIEYLAAFEEADRNQEPKS